MNKILFIDYVKTTPLLNEKEKKSYRKQDFK